MKKLSLLDSAHELYAQAEDAARTVPADRKRMFVEASALYLQVAETVSRDKIAQTALVYLAAQAIQRKDMLDIEEAASTSASTSSHSTLDRGVKHRGAPAHDVLLPSSANDRIATVESVERVGGLSNIAKATHSSTDVINDLVCLEQKLGDIDYVRPLLATVNGHGRNFKVAQDEQRIKPNTIHARSSSSSSRLSTPSSGKAVPPVVSTWLTGWSRPSPHVDREPPRAAAAEGEFSDISQSQQLFYHYQQQRADDGSSGALAIALASLHAGDPRPSPSGGGGDGESVLRLLAAVQRLSEENAALLRQLEAYPQAQARERELRGAMDAFRAEYASKFVRVKKALTDFVTEYPSADNPARAYISATTAASSSSKDSSGEARSAALRQQQLEAAVEALVKRLERSAHDVREKERLIKKYEPYYRAARVDHASPHPAPAARLTPSSGAARSAHTSTLAALLKEHKRDAV